jgi:hypothetical protein
MTGTNNEHKEEGKANLNQDFETETDPMQVSAQDQHLTPQEWINMLSTWNDNLELQVKQLQKQIEDLQQQLHEATRQSSSQTVTPQYIPAKSFYTSMNTPSPSSKTASTGSGTYTASAGSSTASASSGTSTASASSNIQEHQDQQESADEEELKNAKIDRDNAQTENYHLTNTVRYFMQANNNHWMLLMKLAPRIPHTEKGLVKIGQGHIAILEASSRYIFIRMKVNAILSNPSSNMDNTIYTTVRVPLLNEIIEDVDVIYRILDTFQDSTKLPNLPRALVVRSGYLKEIRTICQRQPNPQEDQQIKHAMRELTNKIGESMYAFEQERK